MTWLLFLKCFTGPDLYRKYKNRDGAEEAGTVYEPNFLERNASHVFLSFSILRNLGICLSPILIPMLYRRGWFTYDWGSRTLMFFALVYTVAWMARGFGRVANQPYLRFLATLQAADQYAQVKPTVVRQLHGYDFDFVAWPVEYRWQSELSGEKVRDRPKMLPLPFNRSDSVLKQNMFDAMAWMAAHSFGRRLLFPGAVWLMQLAVKPMIYQGRDKLVREHGGQRHKLVAANGEVVESMFVDRRNNSAFANGNTLVICCEGNAGYLEVGCMASPLEAGYSVVGWNHPGFGGSSGSPWPSFDRAAVDVVMQYAIARLGFEEHEIAVYGWSIGGFATTWAAMVYPAVKGVLLDATFDDVVPLAIPRMPKSLSSVVVQTVRQYLDLPIQRQLSHYNGPVHFIRRTKDEVIVTDESSLEAQKQSNRANTLLRDLLLQRYGKLIKMELINAWLNLSESERYLLRRTVQIDDVWCVETLRKQIELSGGAVVYPLVPNKGTSQKVSDWSDELTDEQLTAMNLFLVRQHFSDFDTTHCTPLPGSLFRIPVQPWDYDYTNIVSA